MNDLELAVAAFTKIARGEAVSLSDAQRVWTAILNNGLKIDTGNQDAMAQFHSELKANVHKLFFATQ